MRTPDLPKASATFLARTGPVRGPGVPGRAARRWRRGAATRAFLYEQGLLTDGPGVAAGRRAGLRVPVHERLPAVRRRDDPMRAASRRWRSWRPPRRLGGLRAPGRREPDRAPGAAPDPARRSGSSARTPLRHAIPTLVETVLGFGLAVVLAVARGGRRWTGRRRVRRAAGAAPRDHPDDPDRRPRTAVPAVVRVRAGPEGAGGRAGDVLPDRGRPCWTGSGARPPRPRTCCAPTAPSDGQAFRKLRWPAALPELVHGPPDLAWCTR